MKGVLSRRATRRRNRLNDVGEFKTLKEVEDEYSEGWLTMGLKKRKRGVGYG